MQRVENPMETVAMNGPYGNYDCKYCGSSSTLRSHRRHFFEFLRSRLTGKVPFRCRRCDRRFWAAVDPRYISKSA